MGGFPQVFGYGAFKLLSSLWLTNGAPSLNGMDPPGKMMWLKQHEPDIWARTHKFLDVKDWLVHKACGRFVTTADSANLTWMMDTRPSRNRWSPYLMKRFGISEPQLPEIVPGTSSPGGLTRSAAAELGLAEGLPVIAGCGDVCAAALGSGSVGDGELAHFPWHQFVDGRILRVAPPECQRRVCDHRLSRGQPAFAYRHAGECRIMP